MNKRRTFNSKRQFAKAPIRINLEHLAITVRYGGNPEHKRNPGDFGLTPPSMPRRDKTLCDAAGIFTRQKALSLLQEGIRRGMISELRHANYPQNIWAISEDGIPLEAQLENAASGTYHGYPMPEADPFRDVVIAKWHETL